MSNRGRILVLGAPSASATSLVAVLSQRGFAAERVTPATTFRDDLADWKPDAVVALGVPDPTAGVELTRRICTDLPGLPVVLVVAVGSTDVLDPATRAGAFAVLQGLGDHPSLVLSLDRAIEHRALRREVRRLEKVVRRTDGFGDLLGNSPPMRTLYETMGPAAASDVPVLITGESGTGKEVAARALHRQSRASGGPFVPVNVAAVPDGLLESELFGHARGAFTDARQARQGLFVRADKGTLFLDEIGELSLSLQPKLLRALQERQVRPVGSDEEVPFQARIIAATNRDLEAEVAAGRFREDLYYRLAVIHLELPPLRARSSDVLVLAQHLLSRVTRRTGKGVEGVAPDASRLLLAYRWPGNVRELENVIERAVALTQQTEITAADLPMRIRNQPRAPGLVQFEQPAELVSMAVVEERYIRQVLAATAGNKTWAARILGFDRKTLYRKMARYGLAPDA